MTPKNMIIMAGSVAGSLVAIWALWVQLGGSVPATQNYVDEEIIRIEADTQKLTLESARWGVELYRQKLRNLTIVPAPVDSQQRSIWEEIVRDTEQKLQYYEQREIDLHQ